MAVTSRLMDSEILEAISILDIDSNRIITSTKISLTISKREKQSANILEEYSKENLEQNKYVAKRNEKQMKTKIHKKTETGTIKEKGELEDGEMKSIHLTIKLRERNIKLCQQRSLREMDRMSLKIQMKT
ncbi:hypothetical protein WA026_015129 [Henosepilachna vigintioctopunctata]|uniref:Uncharacterized protein n=1 Tax=Henosepilachna vigintioctopunctata TaxID=420089 RepID=A0AAW1TVN5_9CUCU